ncbi:UNVERIFIED_CONTAM: hypothetical protein FKN15_008514 [Acipenser sinensis]
MQRFLPKKKLRRSGIWGLLALLALSVAVVSLVFTALSWGHTRSLSRSLQTLQDRLVQVTIPYRINRANCACCYIICKRPFYLFIL